MRFSISFASLSVVSSCRERDTAPQDEQSAMADKEEINPNKRERRLARKLLVAEEAAKAEEMLQQENASMLPRMRKRTAQNAINLAAQEDSFEKVLDAISEGKIFSKMDMTQGFRQLKLAEESMHKTAFSCYKGVFEYCVGALGMTNVETSIRSATEL